MCCELAEQKLSTAFCVLPAQKDERHIEPHSARYQNHRENCKYS